MKLFKLPDLGEGLVEVEIVAWHVAVGDRVAEDDPLISVETAKAVVEIPSPESGCIEQCYGQPGDIVQVGDPLVEFVAAGEGKRDTGTVVGRVESSDQRLREEPQIEIAGGVAASGMRATPAVRALAHRLNVELSVVTPSGRKGNITAADVERVARLFAEVGPLEPLRGARRSMANNMTRAHAEVVAVTVSDDADIDAWCSTGDITLRLIRALIAGCEAEPSLNAWYDSHSLGRRLLRQIHLGVAVDTPDGLFVPVLRNAAGQAPEALRAQLDALKQQVVSRKIPPEALRGQTITLSNFGTFAGRYADPVIMPPTVAILGAGRARREAVVSEGGELAAHMRLPLSLSFDHRAVTGGEASRFLARVIEDLQRSE